MGTTTQNIDLSKIFSAKMEFKSDSTSKDSKDGKDKDKDSVNKSKKKGDKDNDIVVRGRDWLSVAKDISHHMSTFVNEMYVPSKTND